MHWTSLMSGQVKYKHIINFVNRHIVDGRKEMFI